MAPLAEIKQYVTRIQVPGVSGVPTPFMRRPDSDRYAAADFERSAGDLATGARRLVSAVNFREEEQAKAWSASSLSEARLQWTQEFVNRQSTAEPGAAGFTPKLLKDFDEYSDKAIANAPTATAQNFMRERLTDLRMQIGEKATMFEANAAIDWRKDQFNKGIDNSQKLMNTDPSQYQTVLAEQLAVIGSSALPPIQKSQMEQQAINNISQAAVWSQIQKSPSLFLDSIGFNSDGKTRKSTGDLQGITGNVAFDALPFDKRAQLFESAIRLKAQVDADANRAAADRRKVAGDEAMKEGWNRLFNGGRDGVPKLTRDYIESVRPVLSDSEYKSMYEALRKPTGEGGNKTDPGTFRELQRLIYSDPTRAQEFAFTAHRNGLLSNEALSSTLGRSRELSRSEGPKSEYERSRAYIVGQMDPGPMVQDPVGRSRLAEAVDTFDRWVNNGQKKTDDEVFKRGREVVQQYKFINMSDTVMALPSPRSGQIRRTPQDAQGMAADIVAAAKEAQRKRDARQITPQEYDDEMAILNRWRKAVTGATGGR